MRATLATAVVTAAAAAVVAPGALGLCLVGRPSPFRAPTMRQPMPMHRRRGSERTRVRSSSVSQERDEADAAGRLDRQSIRHPHSHLWTTTLSTSPNCRVHPSVELAIRPPSEGGTGIVVTSSVPADTAVLSLPLEEVGMLDAASILDSYDDSLDKDAVFDKLKEMWNNEVKSASSKEKSEEGKRLAVLAGVVAHLQLTRYEDKTSWTSNLVGEGHALNESRRLGPFLDAMPLLPQSGDNNNHPFPTHFLYWTDDEVQHLLKGTMGQTKAREVRAGIGLVVREWSAAFLEEHSGGATQKQILDAIFSAFTAVLSRSFGDAAGRDVDGKGRMLVPLVDMLNHDGEDPNVKWTWNVGEGDEEMIEEGKGDIVVTTLRDVEEGEELLKCYGWRPAWDIASSYGFVPALKKERWECAVVPLFPAVLDLAPDAVPTPSQKANDETSLDLTLESNYGPLVKAVLAAVDAASEIKARQKDTDDSEGDATNEDDDDRPGQLDRLEVVSLFRPPPKSTAGEFPFPRRQPCVVVGTKIQSSGSDGNNTECHRRAIEAVLPAFRAAASAISQLRKNHQDSSESSVEASRMAMAAASIDQGADWDGPALELLKSGIDDRIGTLVDDGKSAEAWLSRRDKSAGVDDEASLHRRLRADVARDVRDAETMVLRTLREAAHNY